MKKFMRSWKFNLLMVCVWVLVINGINLFYKVCSDRPFSTQAMTMFEIMAFVLLGLNILQVYFKCEKLEKEK